CGRNQKSRHRELKDAVGSGHVRLQAVTRKREENRLTAIESVRGAPVPASSHHDVTELLNAWSGGRHEALDELIPLVYDELRRIARRQMKRERAGASFQTTTLIHEAYLKLVDQTHAHWRDRAHFFAVASQLMRRIAVDHARARLADKRGGGLVQVSIDDAPGEYRDEELLAIDEALSHLEQLDPQQCRVVELRFFGGLTIEETAVAMRISTATVKREWSTAKAWLYHEVTRTLR
ncbi:MAG TPA: sigma-70 family RNA polymerase sigma factor, partial [Thermoanaerobaculia bacterium]|nr:sigma-70 family RNA polymerase sigma factor [Thermoanaerobaculia bacterium]